MLIGEDELYRETQREGNSMGMMNSVITALVLLTSTNISADYYGDRGYGYGSRQGQQESQQLNQRFGPRRNLKVAQSLQLFRKHSGKELKFVELQVEKIFRPHYGAPHRDRVIRSRDELYRRPGMGQPPHMRGSVAATLVINGMPTRNVQMIYGRAGLNTIRFTIHRAYKTLGSDIRSIQVQFDKPVFVYDVKAKVARKFSGPGGAGKILEKQLHKRIQGKERMVLSRLIDAGPRASRKYVKKVILRVKSDNAKGAVKLCHYSDGPKSCIQKQKITQYGGQKIVLMADGYTLGDLDLIVRTSGIIKKVKVVLE